MHKGFKSAQGNKLSVPPELPTLDELQPSPEGRRPDLYSTAMQLLAAYNTIEETQETQGSKKRKTEWDHVQNRLQQITKQVHTLQQQQHGVQHIEPQLTHQKMQGQHIRPNEAYKSSNLANQQIPVAHNSQQAQRPSIAPQQVSNAQSAYHNELQEFSVKHRLLNIQFKDHVFPASTMQELVRMVKIGVNLVKVGIAATGEAAKGLQASRAAAVAPQLADRAAVWDVVVQRLQLQPQQIDSIKQWFDNFYSLLDTCYGKRILIKSKIMQPVNNAASDANPTGVWSESLMLNSAKTSGYALSSKYLVELEDAIKELNDNIKVEKLIVCSEMEKLLTQILSPPQAAAYLLSSYPYSYNGLAFAHAVFRLHRHKLSSASMLFNLNK